LDYEDHEVAISDQLTAYWLANPEAGEIALCVFVKTKEVLIEWHFAKRGSAPLGEYLARVQLISGDIAASKFYKRPGKLCSYCDFLRLLGGQEESPRNPGGGWMPATQVRFIIFDASALIWLEYYGENYGSRPSLTFKPLIATTSVRREPWILSECADPSKQILRGNVL